MNKDSCMQISIHWAGKSLPVVWIKEPLKDTVCFAWQYCDSILSVCNTMTMTNTMPHQSNGKGVAELDLIVAVPVPQKDLEWAINDCLSRAACRKDNAGAL